jgi:hypothetical protein
VRSSGSADRLALDEDLPTTADDVLALRKAREVSRTDLDTYLRFLERLEAPPPQVLRARRGPGGAPFVLSR